jgi:hypothetical protein
LRLEELTDPQATRNAFPNDNTGEKPKSNEWIGRIESASREEQSWRTRATVYWRRYLNRYNSSSSAGRFDWSKARSNIFFSNTEFFRSAVLPEMPEPVIRERYAKQEADDDQQKQFFATCADIVERAIEYAVKNLSNKKAVEMFKNDALITGRGVLWVVFNADNNPMDGSLSNERIELKHLSYNDFRMSPSRNWDEVWWVARRILLDKKGLKKRFGPEVAEKTSFTYPTSEDEIWKGDNAVQFEQRAIVWEIWDKKSKKVFFVSPGNSDILEENPAPYGLANFFPTPEPLRLVVDPNTMIPNPEFDIYEKEAMDLSIAAERRSTILQSIRARCFVPSTFVDDVEKMNEASDASYVPLTTNDGMLQEGQTVENIFLYEPIEARANVLDKLAREMDALTSTIFDITGRSDAMNDAGTQPGEGGEAETATRTIMKGKFGSLRLQKKQELFNDYINEIYKICSELICEMYTVQTLMDITSVSLPTTEEKQQDEAKKQQKEQEQQAYEQQMQQFQAMQQQQPQQDPNQPQDPNAPPPEQPQEPQPPEEEPLDIRYENYIKKPTWDEVRNYLKDTRLQAYLLEVETEMNVWEADSQTQQARVSLFDTFIEKIEKIMPITQEHPEFSDVLMSLLGFVLDSFKMPASQRNELDDSMQAVQTALKQAALSAKQNPPPPGPEEIAAKAEETKAQAEMTNAQTKQQESQVDGQIKQQEVAAKQQEIQGKTQIEQMKYQIDLREIARKEMETQSNTEIAKMKLQLEQMRLQAMGAKEDKRAQAGLMETNEKTSVAREKIKAEAMREQMKMTAKIQMENEKLRNKLDIEKSKLIEKAASADQEYELQQQEEADDDLNLE